MEKNGSIIIVDDDESLLNMLKESFFLEGYACETFARAAAALKELENKSFDVLVADIVMPGMQGLELTKKAKQLRPDLIAIVMTGYIDDFSYGQAIEAGASDFIKKPFTIRELLIRIRHVKMQERLREMSITDELTGLLNRRGFFALAHQQLKAADRAKRDMTHLFCDLDDFKMINDTWGHQKGDDALAELARIFRKTFRESDIIARMSGDEFAVLLVDAPVKNFTIIHERLLENLEARNAQRDGAYALSISMGLAVYDHNQRCTVDELLKQADAAMYEQKQRRKNRGASSGHPKKRR